MERLQGPIDCRAARAARSLYINRHKQALIEGRIDRATSALTAYLALAGLTAATLGSYEVSLVEGDLEVRQVAVPDGRQLRLPELGTAVVAVESAPATQLP